jgi:hypothetical protein
VVIRPAGKTQNHRGFVLLRTKSGNAERSFSSLAIMRIKLATLAVGLASQHWFSSLPRCSAAELSKISRACHRHAPRRVRAIWEKYLAFSAVAITQTMANNKIVA